VTSSTSPAHVDLLIRGGQILDGTGAPPLSGDMAIHRGKVHSLGHFGSVTADEEIDARGQVVAPGFVDIHSHGDLVLAWPSDKRLALLEGRLAQGITTEVIGNCGLGAAPLFGKGADIVRHINGWMTPAPYPWEWKGLSEYLSHIEDIGVPLNVGTLVPHGPLRIGARGLYPGDSDSVSLGAMEAELDKALEEGAFGLSSGLIYPPGMYTSTDELIRLVRGVARHDAVFTSHIRGSSETLISAVEELVRIGFETGAHVHHSHAEAVGRSHWPKLELFMETEEKAWSEGIRITRDMFPYPVAATMMLAIYPPWSLEGGLPELLERLKDRPTRRRIENDIEFFSPQWPPWTKGGWPHNLVRAVGWDRIRVSTVVSETNRELEGLSLAELGERTGKSPFDAISDLMLEEDGNVGQFVLDISGEEGLRRLIKRPDVAFITDANDFGKGKPHPAAYGSFPRILGRYVREQSVLTLPEAVRRMTSLPADIIGLEERGRLKKGSFADVVVFDPHRIVDRATIESPRQTADGIATVLVNGRVVYHNGKLTGALPGHVLRNG
jgi:N-acyl-D-amino-acid deacylase